MEKDPITSYRARLLDDGIEPEFIEQLEQGVAAAVEEATTISKASPPPDPSLLEKDVFADGGAMWRN